MQTRKDGSMSSYYRDSLDYPHTQMAKSRSGNETVRKAWSHPSQLHVVTKVFWSALSGTFGYRRSFEGSASSYKRC